jgi:hypothetical protein
MTKKKTDPNPSQIKTDTKGQFVRTRHGANNDGMVSADPRVLSGKKDGDSTFKNSAEANKHDQKVSAK